MAAMDRERRWQSSQANAVGLRKVEIRKGDLQCHLSRLSAILEPGLLAESLLLVGNSHGNSIYVTFIRRPIGRPPCHKNPVARAAPKH